MSPVGEIELTTAAALRRTLSAAVRSHHEVWLDLTRVTFMDVAGLHVLLGMQRELDRDHRRLGVVVRDGVVRRLIDAAEVDGTFAILCDRRRTPRAG